MCAVTVKTTMCFETYREEIVILSEFLLYYLLHFELFIEGIGKH